MAATSRKVASGLCYNSQCAFVAWLECGRWGLDGCVQENVLEMGLSGFPGSTPVRGLGSEDDGAEGDVLGQGDPPCSGVALCAKITLMLAGARRVSSSRVSSGCPEDTPVCGLASSRMASLELFLSGATPL